MCIWYEDKPLLKTTSPQMALLYFISIKIKLNITENLFLFCLKMTKREIDDRGQAYILEKKNGESKC